MGLDMYLFKTKKIKDMSLRQILNIQNKIYFGNRDLIEKYKDDIIEERFGFTDKVFYTLSKEICYWRKSNQIHKWFVDNVQNGEDDCGQYLVTKQNLEDLLALCDRVLKDESEAKNLLPTQAGFYFGSTDYDEYYIKDLIYTRNELEKILKDFDFDSNYLYYTSSW